MVTLENISSTLALESIACRRVRARQCVSDDIVIESPSLWCLRTLGVRHREEDDDLARAVRDGV